MKKTKSIIKEFFILLLVVIAIGLVLAIILYGYSPSGKIVPNKVEYATPDNIKEEISSTTDSETSTPVTVTYELDQTQINNSKQSGSLTAGKQNPFAKAPAQSSDANTEDSENTKDNSNSNNSNTASSEKSANTTNQTQYLPSTSGK